MTAPTLEQATQEGLKIIANQLDPSQPAGNFAIVKAYLASLKPPPPPPPPPPPARK